MTIGTRLFGFLLLAINVNCFATSIYPPCDPLLIPVRSKATRGSNAAGFRMLPQIYQQDVGTEKNIVFSPWSLSLALTLAANGAQANTQSEVLKFLNLDGQILSDANKALAHLVGEFIANAGDEVVRVANSIWSDQTRYDFLPGFLATVKNEFGAEARARDFGDPATVAEVNAWVHQATGGMIGKILDQLSPDDIALLINALYFKAPWLHPFNKFMTVEAPFQTRDGSVVKVQMMHENGKEFSYFEDTQAQVISLPFGSQQDDRSPLRAGRFALDIVLPKPGQSIDAFAHGLTEQQYLKWIEELESRDTQVVDFRMPKFNMSFEKSLADLLKAQGIQDLFTAGRADLGAMGTTVTGERPFVSSVLQKAAAEADENGFKAAAVTVVTLTLESVFMPPTPSATMTLDRPFFFALRDTVTGLILFQAYITDPTKN